MKEFNRENVEAALSDNSNKLSTIVGDLETSIWAIHSHAVEEQYPYIENALVHVARLKSNLDDGRELLVSPIWRKE